MSQEPNDKEQKKAGDLALYYALLEESGYDSPNETMEATEQGLSVPYMSGLHGGK